MSGRIRSIKPEWLDDERMAMASSEARVLSISLMLLADDYGRGRANLTMLAGRVFPGVANPRETLANALGELARLSFVVLYDVDGQSYFAIRNWTKHQRVDKPGKPHVPPPTTESLKIQDFRESSRESRESSGESRENLAPDQDQEGTRKGAGDARAPEETSRQPTPKHIGRFLDSLDPDRPSTEQLRLVASTFSAHRKAAGAGGWAWDGKAYGTTYEALCRVAAMLADEPDPDAAYAAAMRGFLADERSKAANYPFPFFAQDFGAYVAKGQASPSKPSDLAAAEADLARAAEAKSRAHGADVETQIRLGEAHRAAQDRVFALRRRGAA